jgi:O-antigen ligase
MLVFVAWALATDLMIDFRYGYTDQHYMTVGLLKLAKFVLYGVAGILTSRALVDATTRRYFTRSLIVAGLIVGLGLFTVGQKTAQKNRAQYAGYKASNQVSVSAAILACYVAGLRLRRTSMGRQDRHLALASLVVMAAGSGISEGRGGWVAGIAGLLYLCLNGLSRRKAIALMTGTIVFAFILYSYSPVFRHRVYMTLHPETERLEPSIAGIDDGSRPQAWGEGLSQFDSPLLGTGFFHRAGESGLWMSGSHNFFLQMFLETGVPGGLLILVIFCGFWRYSGSHEARVNGFALPARAALVAAFVGGQSGEYFYGGIGLLTLLAVYAECGSLTVRPPVAMAGLVRIARQLYAQGTRSR